MNDDPNLKFRNKDHSFQILPDFEVFIFEGFTGRNSASTSAVVVATNKMTATMALNKELKDMKLPGDATPEMASPFDPKKRQTIIINNGDY